MSRRVRGVALIVRNPTEEILVLQEFHTKEHLGKLSGMFSIPMETAEPGEHTTATLRRLIRQELTGFEARLRIHQEGRGWYRIVPKVWVFVYTGRVSGNDLPHGNGEVGNHLWMHPHDTLELWLRQGAHEMLKDYLSGRTGVVCKHCWPPKPQPV